MNHEIDFDKPAKLIQAHSISQLGEGYRQVLGPTIAEGSVIDLLNRALVAKQSERLKLFICNESDNPLTVDEVHAQAKASGFSVGGG